MPDYPRIGGASAAEVWGYGTRELSGDSGNIIRDAVLSDATKIPGANIDAAISTRSSHAQADVWAVATRALTDKAGFELASQNFPFTNPAAPVDLANVQQALSPTGTGREAKVDKIQDFAEDATGTLTADGTEQVIKEITAGTTDVKLHCYIDLTNMAAGDTVTIREYMTIKSLGSSIKYAEEVYNDAQTLPMLHVITKPARYGIKVTLQQTAVPYRDYDWQTFLEQAA